MTGRRRICAISARNRWNVAPGRQRCDGLRTYPQLRFQPCLLEWPRTGQNSRLRAWPWLECMRRLGGRLRSTTELGGTFVNGNRRNSMGFLNRLFRRRRYRTDDLLGAFELHSVTDICRILDAGLDVRAPIHGKSPISWLLEMYTISDKFPECLGALLDRGAVLDDPVAAPVLLNDARAVAAAIQANPSYVNHHTTMVSAFTPLVGASLLHVAAEYGNLEVARVLIEMGADVNAKAAVDEDRSQCAYASLSYGELQQ